MDRRTDGLRQLRVRSQPHLPSGVKDAPLCCALSGARTQASCSSRHLWRLAADYVAAADDTLESEAPAAAPAAAPLAELAPRIFIRRYAPSTRPWNPFHTDTSAVTINVALNDDADFAGGRLLCCYDGSVRVVERTEGEATIHAATLLHGVSLLTSGVRYRCRHLDRRA